MLCNVFTIAVVVHEALTFFIIMLPSLDIPVDKKCADEVFSFSNRKFCSNREIDYSSFTKNILSHSKY